MDLFVPIFRALTDAQVRYGFEDLWREADRLTIGGIPVPVASIPHLIQMKRAVGRTLDLEDAAALEEIARRRGARP